MEKKLVIALLTYTDDGWYGTRRRYIYSGPDGAGFKTKTEANKFKSLLKKYVKERIKLGGKTQINGEVVCGFLEDFETYRYAGAGPSYSCPNLEVKEEDIKKFQKK